MLKDIISIALGGANGLADALEVNHPYIHTLTGLLLGSLVGHEIGKKVENLERHYAERFIIRDKIDGLEYLHLSPEEFRIFKDKFRFVGGTLESMRTGSEYGLSYAIMYGIGKTMKG